MALNRRIYSYQTRLFFIINVFFWLLVFVFVTLQYSREREYKASNLDARLQVCNRIFIDAYKESGAVDSALVAEITHDSAARVSIMNLKGDVLFDSQMNSHLMSNHKSRPEVMKALALGGGYTICRLSESRHIEYFYSATMAEGYIARTALPYDVTLAKVLKSDMAYIWLILGVTVILNIILYFAIRRITLGVRSLWTFVRKARTGDIQNYDTSKIPDDELGAATMLIVNLYKELKQTENERDRRLEEALFEEKEKIRIKHQLTSNINHELKTPVQAIRGCFETLLNNELDDATVKKLLDSGYHNTMRLNNLLQDVALITRITDAKGTLELSDVDIGMIVKGICDEVDSYSADKKMRINVSVPAGTVVKGNKQLIDAIFRNLINNAIQYSGGRDIFITMTRETNDFYWFDVYDNGSGVEDRHLPRIFERFYRIDSGRSRQYGGTGLGLSIVRNSVLFHGGEIKAQNRKYAGLEFIFSLRKQLN